MDAGTRSLVFTGATGMIGSLALRLALKDSNVASVTSFVRRPSGVLHPKLCEVEHADFSNFEDEEVALTGHDAALFCLGVYTGAVADEEFRRITVDYTVAFARSLHRRSPRAAFCFLSGQGADPSGRSSMAFARYKGEAESELTGIGFPRAHLFRPGYIYPTVPRREPNLMYRILRWLYPAIRFFSPGFGVTSDDLARAMVFAALHGTPEHDDPVLENADIRKLATKGL